MPRATHARRAAFAVVSPLLIARAAGAQAGAQATPPDSARSGAPAAAPAARPYPLAPLPVLDVLRLPDAVRLSGYVAVRGTAGRDSTAFQLQRAVLNVTLHPLPNVAIRAGTDFSRVARFEVDSTITAFVLTDTYVQIVPGDTAGRLGRLGAALIAGQFKVPFSLEYLTSYGALRTGNRSLAVDLLSPRRDIGVLGSIGARRVRVTGAVVNGSGSNTTRNPNESVLSVVRATLTPTSLLEVSAKGGVERGDHLWGADVRWLPGAAVLEGEILERVRRRGGAGDTRASRIEGAGGYALAAYRVLPWLQPVAKWETLRRRGAGATTTERTTIGASLTPEGEGLRLMVHGSLMTGTPINGPRRELVAQLNAVF